MEHKKIVGLMLSLLCVVLFEGCDDVKDKVNNERVEAVPIPKGCDCPDTLATDVNGYVGGDMSKEFDLGSFFCSSKLVVSPDETVDLRRGYIHLNDSNEKILCGFRTDIDLNKNVDYNKIKVKTFIANPNLETVFFDKHPNWYLVDTLNMHYDTNGNIDGDISGTIKSGVSGIDSGLFGGSLHPSGSSSINLKANLILSAITTEKYPKTYINETEFIGLVKKYKVDPVKCVQFPLDLIVAESLLEPYTDICAFERENIQFITQIKSINEEKETCVKTYSSTYSFWQCYPGDDPQQCQYMRDLALNVNIEQEECDYAWA